MDIKEKTTKFDVRRLIQARFDPCTDIPTLELTCGTTTKYYVDVDIHKAGSIIVFFEHLRNSTERWDMLTYKRDEHSVCDAMFDYCKFYLLDSVSEAHLNAEMFFGAVANYIQTVVDSEKLPF